VKDATNAAGIEIVAAEEFADAHTPLCRTARYNVLVVRFKYDNDVVVFTMGVHVLPPFVENSHLITLPVCPVKLSVPLLVPEHTITLLLTDPPTDTGLTVIVPLKELFVQGPVVVTV
jgi:hypothetical protein